MKYTSSHPSKWRQYQARLQKKSRLLHHVRRLPVLVILSVCAFCMLAAAVWTSFWISERWSQASPTPTTAPAKPPAVKIPKLSRDDLPDLLNEFARDATLLSDVFVCQNDGKYYTVRTTIDTKLQKYIRQVLKRSRTLQSAVVVLDASDGRVIDIYTR